MCWIFHSYSTISLSSVLKSKYHLSTRNKCVYLLEVSETSITIWRQEYPNYYYIQEKTTTKTKEMKHEMSVREIFRTTDYSSTLCFSRRRFARSTCTWTVSSIPRLTKTLHQSYNDGMVNPEVVCHPSMAKTTDMHANSLPPFWYG